VSTLPPVCRHRGCQRLTLRTGNLRRDRFCSKHDGATDHGDVCHCATACPTPVGECADCARAVVQLWPAAHYLAAIKAYPSLLDQQVDWMLRHIRGRPDGLDLEQLAQAGAA
jgi:hypothetical protein